MDLLDQLGKKETAPTNIVPQAKPVSNVDSKKVNTTPELDRGLDIINAAKVESKVEPSATDSTSSWTMDSAMKEIKKLRDENKHVRVKYEDTVTSLKKELDERVGQVEEKFKPYLDAAKELDTLKKEEEDKKKDVHEKLTDREKRLAESQMRTEALERSYQEKLASQESELHRYRAEALAQVEIYSQRLSEELATIPAKYKNVADLLVKGAGDPRDALIALSEAKINGLFEDRTIIVNHSVPGANNGARMTNEEAQRKARAELDSLSGPHKIKAAINAMRGGEANSAFQTNLKK